MAQLFAMGNSGRGNMMMIPFTEGHIHIGFNADGASTLAALRDLVTKNNFEAIWIEFLTGEWGYSIMIDPKRPPLFVIDRDELGPEINLSPLISKINAGVPIQLTEHGLLVEE